MTATNNGNATITLSGLTGSQAQAVLDTYAAVTLGTTTGKKTRSKPEKTTVADDEDETSEHDVSKIRRGKKNAKAADTEEEDESTEEEDETEEEDDSDDEVSFSDVKEAIDTYGEKSPKKMKALLLAFNIESTAQLKKTPKKWAPVLRKIESTFEN